jgi:dipeptidyl aminopeptidase/acylaminoacyl peptidase
LVTAAFGLLLVLTLWFVTTNSVVISENTAIWPIRNTVQYHLLRWWWNIAGYPTTSETGTLQGTVRDTHGQPISGAWVLLSGWNGSTFTQTSNQDGQFHIDNIPTGTYKPVVSAPDYQSIVLKNDRRSLPIKGNTITTVDAVLPVDPPNPVTPGKGLALSDPVTLTCTTPLTTTAVRREVSFDSNGQPNQPIFYYTPVTTTTTSQLPVLLTVYPGPADTWECASIPLATAGYAVIATGPAYTFELENDIDELQRLIEFARNGQFPGGNGDNIGLLGGSYSSIHVQRLLQRDQDFSAALLLGPPTDLFDMRRRLEEGTYIPPFGLDQALIALGLPSRESLRYFRYSGAYHVRPDFPPVAILHSRSDDVVPYQQSELLAKNMALIGAPHETHFFDGASHYLLSEEGDKDSLKIYEITLDFLARHLK